MVLSSALARSAAPSWEANTARARLGLRTPAEMFQEARRYLPLLGAQAKLPRFIPMRYRILQLSRLLEPR